MSLVSVYCRLQISGYEGVQERPVFFENFCPVHIAALRGFYLLKKERAQNIVEFDERVLDTPSIIQR